MNRDFLAELKRRNVIRMAGLYLVGAWLVTQVADTVLPMFGAPIWLPRSIVIMLAIGLLPALVFAWVFELTPEGLKRDAEVDPAESIAQQTAKRLDRMIIVVLLLALGYFGIDKFVLAPTREAALQLAAEKQGAARAATQKAAKADAAALDKSIAVLPLVNASGDPDQQYFSDGLSEDLIIALSQFDGLKVISRNSAFQFRDSDESSRTIGARLGVAHLLEGSVRRADDVVRITVQLVKATDGSTLWSQRFDRPFKDLFALQDEITQAVAGALMTQLLNQANAGVVAQSDRPPSGNLDAYTAYLQGRFHASLNTQPDLRRAIEHYTSATKLDPAYAQAWAKLSLTWADNAAFFLAGTTQQQAYEQARVAASTALALDPNLAAAHIARGYLFLVADFNWTGAETEYRRALQLAPNDSEAIFFLGDLLATLGQPAQAVVMTREALSADPLNTAMYNLLFQYLSALGRLDEAEQAIRKAIELQPRAEIYHAQLANLEIQRGDAKAALAAARQEPEEGGFRKTALALALQIGDDRAAADAALQDLIDAQASGSAFQIAQAYALRRDPDRMFQWLDRAWTNRDPGISQLLYDPFIMLYQDDPRLTAYRRKVGLPVRSAPPKGGVQ